jgi:hypothetical protein
MIDPKPTTSYTQSSDYAPNLRVISPTRGSFVHLPLHRRHQRKVEDRNLDAVYPHDKEQSSVKNANGMTNAQSIPEIPCSLS